MPKAQSADGVDLGQVKRNLSRFHPEPFVGEQAWGELHCGARADVCPGDMLSSLREFSKKWELTLSCLLLTWLLCEGWRWVHFQAAGANLLHSCVRASKRHPRPSIFEILWL